MSWLNLSSRNTAAPNNRHFQFVPEIDNGSGGVSMKIAELMDGIRDLDLVLPEFQREYVWSREQAKQLMVSLFKGYPTGSLLFWKTSNPPDIKNSAVSTDQIGTTLVILDGQQRLTTLYMLIRNSIPPYYTKHDIKDDPRPLYFNLESGDFQYYQLRRMESDPTWVPVVDCFSSGIVNEFQIAQKNVDEDDDPFQLAQRYNTNLTRLRNITEKDYPIQYVPSDANIDAAIDVFDRVNSLGTKLSDAELALAHVTGKWPQARQAMKDKASELDSLGFGFDLTFLVRSLTGVVRGRALFETIHAASREELEHGWHRLVRILDYLVSLLPNWGYIHSTNDLNTTNVLVPAVVYLSRRGGEFKDERTIRQFIRWVYAASSWARYTSQTDQRLDHDVSIILQNPEPWGELIEAIVDQRGRIELQPGDLEGRGVQHPFYRMTYILTKRNGAVDWSNGLRLDKPHGASYGIHSHHIFPQALLYKHGNLANESHLDCQLVNEIANRAFLTGSTNIGIGAKSPEAYFPAIEDRYPGALASQFVPMEPALWRVENYRQFLNERRKLIAAAFNSQMEQLLQDLPETKPKTLEELIAAGESTNLEFKSTLRWDVRNEQVNKDLQRVVAKSVAGLLNTEGGTLVIGVTDEGDIYGIERDISSLGRKDVDGFFQALVQVLENHLGREFVPFVSPRFEEHNGSTICILDIDSSPRPVYFRDGQSRDFFVRIGNTTRPLDLQAAHEYIGMQWEN
jgi:hypothetical protein